MQDLFQQAYLTLLNQAKQTPNATGEEMLRENLAVNQGVFDDNDYFYLAWFSILLSEAKKLSKAERSSFSKLAVAMYVASVV
ncbi:hypothetical protein A1D23_10295 [Chelonobacter oris]|uniref:hypothetical protein n=1 Tax=Chelonobacter oris TaxID=505317 RepID=UPI00244D1AE7|nr:hypothetical protein [Chelonobacter oris]MDH3000846.1 hypothetical protein [Chelonobacter oris]